MLKIENKNILDFPHLIEQIPLPSFHHMEFSLVRDDGDELTQAIERDVEEHDNNWELVEHPNPDELENFWTTVTNEVRNDPDWNFASDDED
jgi:hypothetical protein